MNSPEEAISDKQILDIPATQHKNKATKFNSTDRRTSRSPKHSITVRELGRHLTVVSSAKERRRMQEDSLRVAFSTLVTLVVVVVAKPLSRSQPCHVSTSGKPSLLGERPCPVNVDRSEGGRVTSHVSCLAFSILQSSFDDLSYMVVQAHWKARTNTVRHLRLGDRPNECPHLRKKPYECKPMPIKLTFALRLETGEMIYMFCSVIVDVTQQHHHKRSPQFATAMPHVSSMAQALTPM